MSLTPSPLCTVLPPSPPCVADEDYWIFDNGRYDDCACSYTLEITQGLYESMGLPYTVRHDPIIPMEERELEQMSDSYIEEQRAYAMEVA
jgi:hypothetical protein